MVLQRKSHIKEPIGNKAMIRIASKEKTPTSFRLYRDTHGILRKRAKKDGCNIAKVFDDLLEIYEEAEKVGIADELLFPLDKHKETTRITYIIHKKTLRKINALAEELKDKKINRDSFINSMAIALEDVEPVDPEERRQKYREIISNVVNPFFKQALKLRRTMIQELGEQDPGSIMFEDIFSKLEEFRNIIEFYK